MNLSQLIKSSLITVLLIGATLAVSGCKGQPSPPSPGSCIGDKVPCPPDGGDQGNGDTTDDGSGSGTHDGRNGGRNGTGRTQDQTCLMASCGDLWIHHLSSGLISELGKRLGSHEQSVSNLGVEARITFSSAVLSHELAQLTGERAEPWTIGERDKEGYLWLFEQFFDETGILRGSERLQQIPQNINKLRAE
jgi:hypothetical protein